MCANHRGVKLDLTGSFSLVWWGSWRGGPTGGASATLAVSRGAALLLFLLVLVSPPGGFFALGAFGRLGLCGFGGGVGGAAVLGRSRG